MTMNFELWISNCGMIDTVLSSQNPEIRRCGWLWWTTSLRRFIKLQNRLVATNAENCQLTTEN